VFQVVFNLLFQFQYYSIVDYAHTPDALKMYLKTINDIRTKKRAIIVGCGGDRDKTKDQ
jgi:UDP-N-acetylmuramoyl-L-alanyl-D-glutamate--2,6-diaminopimelate ligase